MDSKGQPTGDAVDVIVSYQTYGDAASLPLLLCSGVVINPQAALWGADFCEALAAAGFYVITFDPRDSGASTKLEAAGDPPIVKVVAEKALGITMERKDGIPYFISDLAADAVGLLDHLKISAAHVVGFSNIGGSTAQRVLIDFADRVASLTLISAGTADFGLPAPPAEVRDAFQGSNLATGGDSPEAFLLGTGKIVMGAANFDESRATAIAAEAVKRCPTEPVLLRRLLCAVIADLPRVLALQDATTKMARNQDKCNRGPLSVKLTTTEKIPAQGTSKAYTAFVAEVRCGGELVNTLKSRYSEFLDLRDKLEKSSSWKAIIGNGKDSGFTFPPKSVFGSFESTIIKDRITGITAWFEKVLSTPGLKDCYEVCKFLGVPCGEASPCVVVHGVDDKVMAFEHAESCAKACVGADLVQVPDMGHELLGFAPNYHEAIIAAINTAVERSGSSAGAAPEPEPAPVRSI